MTHKHYIRALASLLNAQEVITLFGEFILFFGEERFPIPISYKDKEKALAIISWAKASFLFEACGEDDFRKIRGEIGRITRSGKSEDPIPLLFNSETLEILNRVSVYLDAIKSLLSFWKLNKEYKYFRLLDDQLRNFSTLIRGHRKPQNSSAYRTISVDHIKCFTATRDYMKILIGLQCFYMRLDHEDEWRLDCSDKMAPKPILQTKSEAQKKALDHSYDIARSVAFRISKSPSRMYSFLKEEVMVYSENRKGERRLKRTGLFQNHIEDIFSLEDNSKKFILNIQVSERNHRSTILSTINECKIEPGTPDYDWVFREVSLSEQKTGLVIEMGNLFKQRISF